MIIKFERVAIHNFKSIGDIELKLSDQGVVLVSGKNNNPCDNAKSNGAGKSSWSDAIVWAITGQTSAGISSNLTRNKSTDGMYVELEFSAGTDSYRIIRSKDSAIYKTDLKIYINGEDKSGKGIQASKELLKEYLPELTSSLIGSVIILGQGLPQRFSNNSPKDRKELLEKLSQSDFMIEDLKERIANRKAELCSQQQSNNTSIACLETEINCLKQKIDEDSKSLESISLDTLKRDQAALVELDETVVDGINSLSQDLTQATTEKTNHQQRLVTLTNEQSAEAQQLYTAFTEAKQTATKNYEQIKLDANIRSSTLNQQLKTYQTEYKELQDGVCPTCHQAVSTQALTNLQDNISSCKTQLAVVDQKFNEDTAQYKEAVAQLTKKYDQDKSAISEKYQALSADVTSQIQAIERKISQLQAEFNKLNSQHLDNASQLSKIAALIEFQTTSKETAEQNILRNNQLLQVRQTALEEKKNTQTELQLRAQIITKMETLTKRDFRSWLLTDVVSYLNAVMVDYSKLVFNNSKVELVISGNDIALEYDGRDVSLLSGGERQKVDLVVQFALREMLCSYMHFSSNLLVIDEGFDALDSVGCEKIIDMITQKLSDVESLYIISHHINELSIPTDRELVIVKDENGVSGVEG